MQWHGQELQLKGVMGNDTIVSGIVQLTSDSANPLLVDLDA